VIHTAAFESTVIPKNKNPAVMNLTMEIRELIKNKRKARKTWQITRSPVYKSIFNNLCLKVKNAIKEANNESLHRYLTNLTGEKNTDYSLWKATKGLKRPVIASPPLKKEDRTWARSAKQKAD
jgi:hypothetical protein